MYVTLISSIMIVKLFVFCLIIIPNCETIAQCNNNKSKPNIVVIMADDLGFADIGLHGSEFPTPNMDALAMHGVLINKFYTPPMCTPSRSSFVTGKYAIRQGMNHFVIDNPEPWGLGLNEKNVYQIFGDGGYETYLVGKWHLGFYNDNYIPTKRGVNNYFGYWGAYIDYFDHTFYEIPYARGLDLRKQENTVYDRNGTYATNMLRDEAITFIKNHDTKKPMFMVIAHLAPHAGNFDKPMQAPKNVIKKFSHIKDPKRRTYAAMVHMFDISIGSVTKALENKKILDNTIILFFSDNGAPTYGLHSNLGSNYPLRGQKNSPWEGSMRVPAAIWSKDLQHQQPYQNLFHLTDVLPTLMNAANVHDNCSNKMDGISHWTALKNENIKGPRTGFLYNIDDDFGYYAIQKDGYKLVKGTTLGGIYDGFLGNIVNESPKPSLESRYKGIINSETHKALSKHSNKNRLNFERLVEFDKKAKVTCGKTNQNLKPCSPLTDVCLFKIDEDPCEMNNIAATKKGRRIVTDLNEIIQNYRKVMVPPRNQPKDPNSDPIFHNLTWTYWK